MCAKKKAGGEEDALGNLGELDRIEVKFLSELRRRMRKAGLQNRDLERRLRVNSVTASSFLLGRKGLTFRGAYRYCKALGLEFVPYPGIVCRASDDAFPVLPPRTGRQGRRSLLKKARRRKRHNGLRNNYTYEAKYFRTRASFDPVAFFLEKVVLRLKELKMTKSEFARRAGLSRPYAHRVLSGEISIEFGTAAKIAEALGCSFDPVLCDSNGARLTPGN